MTVCMFLQHAVEIVKNLQRLQGIDGDYDNDSGSGPDRIARRRTVHNLDKASKPRRQIGTLDVAFKKRFLQLTADENNPSKIISFVSATNSLISQAVELNFHEIHRYTNISKTNDNETRNHPCVRSA